MKDFEKGYYCCLAAVLRYDGMPTAIVKELFGSGGCPDNIDESDKKLFQEHGLLMTDEEQKKY